MHSIPPSSPQYDMAISSEYESIIAYSTSLHELIVARITQNVEWNGTWNSMWNRRKCCDYPVGQLMRCPIDYLYTSCAANACMLALIRQMPGDQ